uniref:Uncharacterized protein n=1 Tax=Arundo donax TaxID=35708 RepID=A0A0A9GZ58_ARUDO
MTWLPKRIQVKLQLTAFVGYSCVSIWKTHKQTINIRTARNKTLDYFLTSTTKVPPDPLIGTMKNMKQAS